MNFILISDLHLEGAPNYRPEPVENEKEITLILAGDICEIKRLNILIPFLTDVAARFKNVIYVPGNHEYYDGHMYNSVAKLLTAVEGKMTNFHLLNNRFVNIDGVNFIGSTMWTDFNRGNPMAMWDVARGLNDYRYIRMGNYSKITSGKILSEHLVAKKFLEESLYLLNGQKNVVVTHHAPSTLSISPAYINDPLNPGYVSDLSDLIDQYKPLIWCHGHVHTSHDYMLYDTRVLCNPRGYESPRHGAENPEYALTVIEV